MNTLASNKLASMNKIQKELIELKSSPLYSTRIENNYLVVLGEGSLDANIMIIGEAPGKNEALTGKPFCGAAGRVLDELLTSISFDRSDVYITNIVKDRPPKNRDPQTKEINLYAPFLDRQIEIIQPAIIATLGRFSSEYIMTRYGLVNSIEKISKMHGHIYSTVLNWGKVLIAPLYHPAVALYKNSMKETLLDDFKIIKNYADAKVQNVI